MLNEIGVQTVTPMPNDSDYEEISLPPLKHITPRNQLRPRHFDFNPEVIKPRVQEEPTVIQKAQSKLDKIRKDENRSKKMFQEYQMQAIKMIHIQRKKDEVTFILGTRSQDDANLSEARRRKREPKSSSDDT